MPFGKNARIQLEHGGENESTRALPDASRTGTAAGARAWCRPTRCRSATRPTSAAHDYVSPSASAPVTVRSRYELGVDHVGEREVCPRSTDTGRSTTGTTRVHAARSTPTTSACCCAASSTTRFPDQRAEVFVADDDGRDAWKPRRHLVPRRLEPLRVLATRRGELDPPAPVLQTTNRRFRDDEFLIARALTGAARAIRVRIVFAPERQPLAPGRAAAPSGVERAALRRVAWVLPEE